MIYSIKYRFALACMGFVVLTACVVQSGYKPLPLDPYPNSDSESQNQRDKVYHPSELGYSDKKEFIKFAYAALDRKFGRPAEFPEIKNAGNYDHLFATLTKDGETRCCMRGKADRKSKNFGMEDIVSAVERCLEDARFGGPTAESEIDGVEMELTYLFNKKKESNRESLEKNMEIGIHGLEIKSSSGGAIFKESVPIDKQYSFDKTLERLCKKAGLDKLCSFSKSVRFYIYDAVSFGGDRAGNVAEYYRYNTVLNANEVNSVLISERLKLAENWFLNNVNEATGILEYEYYPHSDAYSEKIGSNLRIVAALWAMSSLKNHLGDDSSLTALIYRMTDYYLSLSECEGMGESKSCYIKKIDSGKIALNAFLILSLMENDRYPDSIAIMESLAEGILRQQREDGSFKSHFGSDKAGGEKYYPGEAMLALASLYREIPDARYLEAVKKAFPYYRDYWRNNKNTAMVPWHTRADRILFEETGDRQYADFIFEMTDWIIDRYQVKESPYFDEIGGMPKGDPDFTTYVYMEGVTDAYAVALKAGDMARAAKYRDSVREGIRFTLQGQFTPENSFFVKNKKRVVGGFRKSLTSTDIRIDYLQHAIFALLKALETGVFE